MPTAPSPSIPTYTDGQALAGGGTGGLNDFSSLLTGLYSNTQAGFRTLKPLCVVYRILTPGGPVTGTDNVIAWDQATANTDNIWSAGQTYDTLHIQTAGWYRLALQVHWDVSPTGIRAAKILVNGTSPSNAVAADCRNAATSGEGTVNFCRSPITYLAAGATVYGSCYQNSGGTIPTIITFSGSFLSAEWVSV